MPSYLFDVTTERGVERHAFTLDDDRPLGPQVTQILEELRLRGVVLRGGSADELGAFSDGRELDQSKRPGELGISASHSVALRMRERAAIGRADRSLPRGVLASSVLGYAGAFVAWIVTGFWTDTTRLIPDYAHLDQLTMAVLGSLVGLMILGGAALRTRGAGLLGVIAGAVLGAAGGWLAATVTVALPVGTSLRGFLLVRLAGWSAAGLLCAGFLSVISKPLVAVRLGETVLLGTLVGAVSGALFALPGPSELWQGTSFLIFGAGLGFAVSGPLLWSAAAIVEAAPVRGIVPGILSLREWPVHEATSIELGDAQVACQHDQLALYPPVSGAMLGDRAITQPTYIRGSARLTIDGVRYRIRVPRVEL